MLAARTVQLVISAKSLLRQAVEEELGLLPTHRDRAAQSSSEEPGAPSSGSRPDETNAEGHEAKAPAGEYSVEEQDSCYMVHYRPRGKGPKRGNGTPGTESDPRKLAIVSGAKASYFMVPELNKT